MDRTLVVGNVVVFPATLLRMFKVSAFGPFGVGDFSIGVGDMTVPSPRPFIHGPFGPCIRLLTLSEAKISHKRLSSSDKKNEIERVAPDGRHDRKLVVFNAAAFMTLSCQLNVQGASFQARCCGAQSTHFFSGTLRSVRQSGYFVSCQLIIPVYHDARLSGYPAQPFGAHGNGARAAAWAIILGFDFRAVWRFRIL